MSGSESRDKDSVTEVAGESFVRERAPEIERGTVLASRYQIEDIIGKGGSGIVLRVFDRVAQNVVALKVLKSELARDAKWEKRFSRELRLGRPIQHPNVCRIFDIGEAEGYRFLTMELASGGSLRDELKRKRALDRPIEERLVDARAVIEGLAALHSSGVVHRDFKPDNILRMGDGRLVLSDFGLATDAANAAGATVMIGTPHYMAPEVLTGEPASSRSDVWALGVVLHEIFFGQRPERRSVSFDGSGRGPLRPSSSIERAMLRLCEICLADTPLDRPADAGAVAEIFDSRRPSRRAQGGRWKRLVRNGVAVSLASALALTVALRWRHHPSPRTEQLNPNIVQLTPQGAPKDLSRLATTLADLDGRVYCLAVTGPHTARVIWGAPRRAEEFDLTTKQRRPSTLAAETYRFGCPDSSPSGKSLLFTASTGAGAAEIRVSDSGDGRDGTTVTAGSDPVWLGTDDEFVYQIDPAHAATFSRPTMTTSLLPDPGFGKHHLLVEAATSKSGSAIATSLSNERAEFAVAVYDGEHFDSFRTFAVPPRIRIQFVHENELVLTSFHLPGFESAMVTVDWKQGKVLDSAHYPDFDIVRAVSARDTTIVVVRRSVSDAWSDGGRGRKRLSTDGRNFSVAKARSGDLLLSKQDPDGNFNIWRQEPNGRTKKLTSGKLDIGPDFAPDERSWVYSDYTTKSIVACDGDSNDCHVLRRDDMLPIWPRFSPDGQFVAYLTQIGAPKLTVVSTKGATVSATWDAHYQCPPIWSSMRTLWDLEMSGGHYSWYERNVISGARTGRHADAAIESGDTGDSNCRPTTLDSDLPERPSAHIETSEISKLVLIPPLN